MYKQYRIQDVKGAGEYTRNDRERKKKRRKQNRTYKHTGEYVDKDKVVYTYNMSHSLNIHR